MENKSHALAAGSFVLVVLSLLVALAVWLTRDSRNLLLYELTSKGAVTGLQPQAAVRFKGVNVGKVKSIGFDPLSPGQVLIRIAVDEQTPITATTFATLGFQGVTGLAFVMLDDAGDSSQRLPSSMDAPARIPLRPGLVSKLTDQGEVLLTQLQEASRRLNRLLEPANQQLLLGAVGNLGQAATSLKQLGNHANQLLPQLAQDASATLRSVQDSSKRVGASVDEGRQLIHDARVLSARLSEPGGTLDKLAESSAALATAGQTLNAATLPHLNHVLLETNRSARALSRVANAVADNPQSLIFGNGRATPGPGEAGFLAPAVKP